MNSNNKSLALCALSLACLLGSATAAPVTLSFSGTIDYGYDQLGEFGAVGRDLSGAAVQVSYSFDAARFETNGSWSSDTGQVEVNVGGASRLYAFDPGSSWFYSYVSRALTNYGPSWSWWWGYNYNYDQVYQESYGYTADGGYVDVYQSVYSYANPMGIPGDANTSWDRTTQSGDSSYGYFTRYDANWNSSIYFSNSVDRMTLRAGDLRPAAPAAADVPEPTTALLAGAGLLAAVIVRRKPLRRRSRPLIGA